jgi:3-deoxy-D-arabino-heptulosonate 7-phosphate (DAHP) synthase class II
VELPPLVFAREACKLEERLGEAAMGHAFLLQGGDYAKSFEDLGANIIHYMFRLMLQVVESSSPSTARCPHAKGLFLHPIAQCPLLSHLL